MPERIRTDPTVIEQFRSVSVPTVVSILWRKGLKNTFMSQPRPVNPNAVKFAGTALTARTVAMREDLLEAQNRGERPNLQNQSVDDMGTGDVLIVAMGGETRTAFMGDIMTTGLMVKGAAGVVLDGSVSDAASISKIDLPVFCTGNAATPLTSHRIVVDLNCPVDCAGVTVLDGDVVMGDANGVVVIPAALAADVAGLAVDRELLEEFVVGRVADGAPLKGTYPPDDATLAAFETWREERGR